MRIHYFTRTILLTGAIGTAVFLVTSNSFYKPRAKAVSEVPVAFWAWRNEAPGADDVQKVFAATKAKILFQRAGQFDVVDGELQRIRSVSGALPSAVDLHLVYNGTRDLLHRWEELDPATTAEKVAAVYKADLSRARNDGAEVSGIQLDFDVPTRLLHKYAHVLKRLRERLPADAQLSITGLPTWASTNDINDVLAAVDFWIPQCYGTDIPTHISQRIPISSAADVKRTISKVRELEKPFYAGLSAYGYAILYSNDGSLVELRGDIDPALAASNTSLELTDTRFIERKTQAGEMQYIYQAKTDLVLDGLVIKAGETLVFDVPTAASLRANARAVRENAGDLLLGICMFRLPTAEDKTTLSLQEITAALSDREPRVSTNINLAAAAGRELRVVAENTGDVSSDLGAGALIIDLEVPAGSVRGVYGVSGFNHYENLCRRASENPMPCSSRRANLVRLKAAVWRPGASVWATLSLTKPLPASIAASVTTRVNDGRIDRKTYEIKIQRPWK